jgi:hypothetical protein
MIFALLSAALFIECENFADKGGWTLDPSSTGEMGSSYLMAHGYGVAVKDASTSFTVEKPGRYSVCARTRNWAAEWTKGAPGIFRIVVDGRMLDTVMGENGPEWSWVKAGEVELSVGRHTLALRDLTGFNGRCDAVAVTAGATDEKTLESIRLKAQSPVPVDGGEYDFIVVGGGVSGICAAHAAARATCKTLLIQDRDVVGGCNSSEIRVGLGGDVHVGPNPRLGNVIDEIQPIIGGGGVDGGDDYEDGRKMRSFRAGYLPRFLRLRTGERVFAIETNATGAITAVLSRNVRSGRLTRFRSALFCDATGDAVLARLAGCATMYGREARAQYNEISAPEKADRQVMGHSIQWKTVRGEAAPFPDISSWALPIDESSATYSRVGGWAQEAGQYRDMALETEQIRDYGLLAIFSNWHYLKNVSPRRAEFARDRFSWISPIGGKREGYRVVGDYVFTQNDLEEQRVFPDGTAAVTWDIDQHFPDPANEAKFREPFRSCAYHRGFGPRPVAVPYRCLYARDCPNLFLAGRHISVTHVALAAVRVQRTLGMLGEAAGIAAALAWEHGCSPRTLYTDYLPELMGRIRAGVPKLPSYHAYPQGYHEKYHFWGRPQVNVHPETETNLFAGAKDCIKALGMVHRNEHPYFKDPPEKETRRRLVLADESRAQLIVYDSCNARGRYTIPAEKPMWDLKRVGEGLYRVVVRRGFMIVDIGKRKVVDVFRHSALNELTAVCDLPDGGFLACVSPGGYGKTNDVEVFEFSAKRELVRSCRFRGIYNSRSMTRRDDGELLIAYEHGFIRGRFGEGGEGEVLQRFIQPAGRNLFEVVPDAKGTGYWAGTGYGAELVHFNLDGTVSKVWKASQEKGRRNVFYAQPQELPSGHVYVCNWTGHGWNDSKRGWQVLEFDENGKVVWHLDDWEMFGSISGIDVIEAPGKR